MRQVSDIRISVRKRGKKTIKFELFESIVPNKYHVWTDGKKSDKAGLVTITEVTHKLRQWLVKGD